MEQQRLSNGTVLIVGAGLAGLFLALKLAPRPCVVLSPAPFGQAASSAWAQGGLAAALAPGDSPKSHAEDTIAAGAGLVDPDLAHLIAKEGPARVRDLQRIGVPFDRDDTGALALSLEAAHSHARVARVAGDLAGREIMASLIKAVRACSHIRLVEGVSARALLQHDNGQIGGILATNGSPLRLEADETVLATGGVGGLFRVTTNPVEAAGHGLGMAARTGALIGDAEFIQFHPTAMDIGRDPAPLATEALRGEGARLVNLCGSAFMAGYHSLGDLAPRDVVARAIAKEIKAGRGAYLDCRGVLESHFSHHFPTVFAACASANLDPRTDLIPIAPAAHYHMGGIVTDLWGKTTLDGLSALGECASTGVHGANRLASNSLLEAVVFADRVATRLREAPLPAKAGGRGDLPPILPQADLQHLRMAMSAHCGVVRDAHGLNALVTTIGDMTATIGYANELVVAQLIAKGALARQESRGGHYRSDFPNPDMTGVRSLVTFEALL
ncbi:L-aspartate oxidase [Candidatus Phycosocius spiralis]|uniref:L-aspartate oxidase n=1 Tax=Candidatus Phycosocius spiralis TaxID=2815099 RepID=A0ABQ4PYR9_9PROT|nr:L-aspartate oxidase [Candidatus Phycosocius spiralis]GIU68134.1 L-aspartate oxidase [Candidatus Phycosocius spiralis]